MSKEEFLKIQKCVLKVNIHCDGCKQKVKKILQKIDGVFTIEIDAEVGKVTVSGNVDPAILIKKLSKSKKYAEIWGALKVNPNSNNGSQQNQMKNLEIDNGKGGGNIKQPKPGNGGGGMQMNGFPFQDPKMLPPQLKGLQMPPFKDPIPAKLDLPEEDDLTDDDDYDDEFEDDEFEDDDFDDIPAPPNKMKPLMGGTGAGGGGGGQMPNMKMMMNGNMNMNMQQLMNAQKAAMGADKKPGGGGSGGAMPMPMNGMGGSGGAMQMPMNGMGGDGKAGKKLGGGNQGHDSGGSAKIGNNNGGGHKNGNNSALGATGHPINNNNNNNNNNGNGSKKVGGEMGHLMNGGGFPNMGGSHGMAAGGGGSDTRRMESMNMPMPQMGANPYQQQQYMAAMMNHQRATMANQPMMYARPPPAVNYLPPYPYPPHPGAHNYTHFFSDENTSSCNVM